MRTDEQILAAHAEYVRPRAMMELAIVHRVIQDALAQGYRLWVDDGEDEVVGEEQKLVDAIFSVEESKLFMEKGKSWGWVLFVTGNDGWDVINDHTPNLYDVLKGADQLAEQLEMKEWLSLPGPQ